MAKIHENDRAPRRVIRAGPRTNNAFDTDTVFQIVNRWPSLQVVREWPCFDEYRL
jgi:hypothetical protein